MNTDQFSGGFPQNFSQQYSGFNIPISRDGAYVIPYSTNLKIFTGGNFTLDQRDKIYLKDNSSGVNYIILFYKENPSQSSEFKAYLNSIQNLFIKISSVSIEKVEFRICNLSADELLNKAFEEVKSNSTHPFNWIRSAKNPDIYILIYSSGYPQMFYEGPLNEIFLSQFANNLSDTGTADNFYKKYGTVNGFFDSRGQGQTYKEQAWIDFKSNPSSFGNLPTNLLVKEETLKEFSGLKLGAKVSEYAVPSFITLPKNKDVIYKTLRDKIKEKYNADKSKLGLGGDGPNYLINKIQNGDGKLSNSINASPYKQYFLPFNIKDEKDQKAKMSPVAEYIYKIARKLYTLKDAYSLDDQQVSDLTINMYGLYRFNQYSISDKAVTKSDVANLFLTENIIPRYALNILPAFYENIATNVADEIKGENLAKIRNIMDYFNKDKNANNQLVDKPEKVFKISDDDAENLWAIVKDKYESLDKEDKKNESKWEIESEDLPANLRSYYDNKNSENENSDVDDLVSNSNGKAMKDLFKIVNRNDATLNLKNPPKTGGGGGENAFTGGGRKGKRDFSF